MQLADSDVESTPDFEKWLAADARHRDAWDQVQDPWNFLGENEASPEFLNVRRGALAYAHEVAHSRWGEGRESPPTGASGIRRKWVVGALAAAVAAIACVGLLVLYLDGPDVYRTKIGERRLETLADGSQVQLDSSTELWVRYSARARDLTLTRGQARFDVAHDVERPFAVTAGGQKVIATGTVFNVDLRGSKVIVTLIEGHVVILPKSLDSPDPVTQALIGSQERTATASVPRGGGRSGQGIELDAGEQLVVADGGRSDVSPANIARSIAWQNGQLVFDDEPLTAVIEQVNRYSSEPLVLADAAAGRLRISGVFRTGDVAGFVDTLTHYLPLDAERRDGSLRLSHR